AARPSPTGSSRRRTSTTMRSRPRRCCTSPEQVSPSRRAARRRWPRCASTAGRPLSISTGGRRSGARPRITRCWRSRRPGPRTSSSATRTRSLLPAGRWGRVTPESAGWRYLGFEVRDGSFGRAADDVETVLVPLSGACRIEAAGQSWEIGGRENVFAGLPTALYLPRDTSFSADLEGDVAVCGARCERRREPVVITPDDVEVEVRGAGNATRQINHVVKPDFPAERILVVEVYTPS